MSLTITPLSSEALTALKGAIAKWKGISEGIIIDHGATNCPLCQLFLKDKEAACVGCPIYQFTGEKFCRETPFAKWEGADYHGQTAITPHQKELAFAGFMFLENLLPSSPSEPSS